MSKLANSYVEASLAKLEQERREIRQMANSLKGSFIHLEEKLESFYHHIDALRRELTDAEKYSVAMYVEPEFVEMVRKALHPEEEE